MINLFLILSSPTIPPFIFVLQVSRSEILDLPSPFGRGDSPLFTYPFFGEEQIVSLTTPNETPATVLDSLEIVFCICNELTTVGAVCFLGSNEEGILQDAKLKIENKLRDMAASANFEIEFHSAWEEFQAAFKVDKCPESPALLIELENDKNVKMLGNESRGTFYNHLQLLLPFFIEAATPIDSTDPKWSIFLQFQDSDQSVTGLLTAYNYFKFPEGTRVRISQVLVLPRYQGHRIGSQLYRSVTEFLRHEKSECKEICVEDPTDAFDRIRGLVDYQGCKILFNQAEDNDEILVGRMIEMMKFTPEHAERLLLLNRSLTQSTWIKRPKTGQTHLRLQIKRWLLKKYRKDLPENGSDRIERLAELYEGEMEGFIEPLIEKLRVYQ